MINEDDVIHDIYVLFSKYLKIRRYTDSSFVIDASLMHLQYFPISFFLSFSLSLSLSFLSCVRVYFRKMILHIISNKHSLNNVNWQFVSVSAIFWQIDRIERKRCYPTIIAGYNLSHYTGRICYKSPTLAHARIWHQHAWYNLVSDFRISVSWELVANSCRDIQAGKRNDKVMYSWSVIFCL